MACGNENLEINFSTLKEEISMKLSTLTNAIMLAFDEVANGKARKYLVGMNEAEKSEFRGQVNEVVHTFGFMMKRWRMGDLVLKEGSQSTVYQISDYMLTSNLIKLLNGSIVYVSTERIDVTKPWFTAEVEDDLGDDLRILSPEAFNSRLKYWAEQLKDTTVSIQVSPVTKDGYLSFRDVHYVVDEEGKLYQVSVTSDTSDKEVAQLLGYPNPGFPVECLTTEPLSTEISIGRWLLR
jgi:hypothetical protein